MKEGDSKVRWTCGAPKLRNDVGSSHVFTHKRASGCRSHYCVERRRSHLSALAPLCTSSFAGAGAAVDLLAEAQCRAERFERSRTLRGFVLHQAQECARSSSEHAAGVCLL